MFVDISHSTVVEGDPKAPFSIVTTPRFRRGRYTFPWITPLTLDPYLIMLNVKEGSIKYQFSSLWYDSTWNWTPISWTIGEHSNHYANDNSNLKIHVLNQTISLYIVAACPYPYFKCVVIWTLLKVKDTEYLLFKVLIFIRIWRTFYLVFFFVYFLAILNKSWRQHPTRHQL